MIQMMIWMMKSLCLILISVEFILMSLTESAHLLWRPCFPFLTGNTEVVATDYTVDLNQRDTGRDGAVLYSMHCTLISILLCS